MRPSTSMETFLLHHQGSRLDLRTQFDESGAPCAPNLGHLRANRAL